jgi:hypothetical protein
MEITKSICFVTTTLYTKWLNYQSTIIKNLFPESTHIIIDGRQNWPYSWFYWIDEVKKSNCEYFIHIDEDFFITDKRELLKAINLLEESDIVGCPDGYHQYRGANPIAINTFLLLGKTEILSNLNFKDIRFAWNNDLGWINNFNLLFKEEYKQDFVYKFPIQGGCNFNFQQEPYYAFLWKLKELGYKFDYLYPHFDDRFKSTNPRISENSGDIGIHMWYTRNWNSSELVHDMPNLERYIRVEEFINFLQSI